MALFAAITWTLKKGGIKLIFFWRSESFFTNTPPPAWFSPAVFLVSLVVACWPAHLRGCAGEQSCGCFEACCGHGCSLKGGERNWRRQHWSEGKRTGGREQVMEQLLKAGAEAGRCAALTSCGAWQDLSPAGGRSPSLCLDSVLECVCACVCMCVCVWACVCAEPRNQSLLLWVFSCTWYSLLLCDLQYLFYYLHKLMLLLSSGNFTQVSVELIHLPSNT